jgi:putative addiction module component (TIGR02574 family)
MHMNPEKTMLNLISMTNVERVYSEIQKLSASERAELSERLLMLVHEEPDPAVEEAWMKESLRRRAEWKAGKVKAIPVEEALELMFAKP